jgi:DNA modification methylase
MPVLQFKGKTAVECYHHTVPHHTLEFDAKLSVLGKGEKPGLDGNLIIEGDNLIALKALLPTHARRIKCIYIDPPYNTGNEGWVYNDNLTQPQFKDWIGQTVGKEGEDATRHDKWCCMMYPRLQLLKELLRDDGAIFISIDDNEVASLRMLMDEIFGPDNLVACFIWQKRYSRDNRPAVGTVHEYVLTYSKTVGRFVEVRNKLTPSDESRAVYRNPNNDPKGDWRPIPMNAQGHRPNQMYAIKTPGGSVHYPPKGRCWSMVESEYNKLLAEGRIWFGNDGKSQPNVIRYWSEVEGFVPWTWWPHEEVGHTDEAKKELFNFFAKDDAFESPKPTRLVKRILQIYTNYNDGDIVLDSFAGSGTTAHAVLELNKEDGGNRRCILVQLPFETKEQGKDKFNICEKITGERVRLVIQGYTYTDPKGKKEKVAGVDGTFTYARVGRPLFGEYRDWGKQLPAYEELAKYIFYTETSRDFDRKVVNEKTGKIGEHHGTSYYLLYTPDGQQDRRLDMEWLKALDKTDKNRNVVVYCEKKWVHPDDLRKYELETKRTVRPMIVPFNLK